MGFIPDSGESPEWFDRPCVEYERNGEPGHRFMCECHVEEKNANDEVPNNPPVDDNDSTETENVNKNDVSSTESTISVSTSVSIENAESSNPDSKVDITTTTTTEDTNQENSGISDSKE